MLKYISLREASSPQPCDPLFLVSADTPLTRSVLIRHLRYLLQRLGLNASHYAGHSFRKGAATTAAAAHIPDHLMKALGRWSSDGYQRYIHTPPQLIKEAQLNLALPI